MDCGRKRAGGAHDGGKKAGFAHADGWAAAAELTPLCSVRPSYRLLRPRYRENLYPAGTSHFPRPWAGHVRRAARPFGYFSYIGKGNKKGGRDFRPPFVCIN